MFATFKYLDFEMMTVWSIDFWDLFFEGRLHKFYPYTSLRLRMREELVAVCTGNYLWLIPWAIWNLPVWSIHKVTGTIKVTEFFSFMWSKVFLIILTFVAIYYLCKIVESVKGSKEYNKLIGLLVLASPEILMSTCYAGQDEILYIALFTMALYYFLENKKKSFISAVF